MRYVVLTFDDGTIYDKRFIEILNKYNIPCSFNLNSGLDDFIWYFNQKSLSFHIFQFLIFYFIYNKLFEFYRK